MQITNTVLMVRPCCFTFNTQTAGNNAFQEKGYVENAQENALKEFDGYVKQLRDAGVEVIVVDDTPEPHTPDSIFPNNWFSVHSAKELGLPKEEGDTLVLYPMNAPNRRQERNKNVLDTLKKIRNIGRVIDLTYFEKEDKFLEGTGSMIIDRDNKIAFCCASARTNQDVLDEWAEKLNYDYFLFDAEDENGMPIYHTNVMMCIGTKYAFICLDAIKNLSERERLIELLEENGKEIIELSFEQMGNFAGNMLVVKNKLGERVLVLSKTAYSSLNEEQVEKIQNNYKTLVTPNIEYIEKNGGGSARCMLAEIF